MLERQLCSVHTDRHTHIHAHIQIHRQTHRQDRQTDRQTDRHIQTQNTRAQNTLQRQGDTLPYKGLICMIDIFAIWLIH